MDNDEFAKKLLEAFATEAGEHLAAITGGVIELEKTPAGDRLKELIETTFRAAHSLKGAAHAVNRADVEAVCQALEGVFAVWKRRPRPVSAEECDVLNGAIDVVSRQLKDPAYSESPQSRQESRDIIAKLRGVESGQTPRADVATQPSPQPAAAPPPPPVPAAPQHESADAEKATVAETVRVPVAKMNSLLRKAEGMIGVKLATRRYAAELQSVGALVDTWRAEWNKTRDLAGTKDGRTTGNGMALASFIEWNRDFMQGFEDRLAVLAKNIRADERGVSSAVDDLLAEAKDLLLLPFSALLDFFPKQVRDLSREQGKEIDLVLHGREVEIDKRILEEMKDALIHLVRNAIDHGCEKPEARAAQGKLRKSTLTIAVARRDGNRIAIEVSDDGAGIDVEKVKASALRHGEITEAEAAHMTREAALALIFQSGVTTSAIITELSGRGLGMAIVREKVERLGGQVSIYSEPGMGTIFRMVLPVTLATFKGIVVTAATQTFVIPTSGIEQIARVKRAAIRSVENRPTVSLNDRVVSLAALADVLELPPTPTQQDSPMVEIIVLGTGEKRVAFVVDEVLTEQEVLVKPLTRPLLRVRNVSSAAVLGAGTPVLILNVADLLKSAAKVAGSTRLAANSADKEHAPKKTVLVADDSVTSRMLLKNILESAGYVVTTAVDGVEAFGVLQREKFDILVTDGEMPRMDGFVLTAKVRADRKLADLPVIIVTALGSAEDRDRGIEAGANAYIVKSTFDQNNLIDIMRKLIA